MFFNPLTATISELQDKLAGGELRSVNLIDTYLSQIEKHNGYLHAVIVTAPRASLTRQAELLDKERREGSIRGPLHGIPILLKDNIATHLDLGMDTTAGSFALAGSRPTRHADLVNRIIEAGGIILGKANLSELSYWKGTGLSCGWSAVGGQTQSAYVRGGIEAGDSFGGHSNPGGSSSGSAVSVSAGFAPAAIGTETDGSLVMPSNRAALYTIKPTIGLISQQGIVPVSRLCDSAGPMTKGVKDLAYLLDVMVDKSKTRIPEAGYTTALTDSWEGLKIGVLDPEKWQFHPILVKPNAEATLQMVNEIRAAYATIRPLAKEFHENVTLIPPMEFVVNGKHILYSIFGKHSFATQSYGVEDHSSIRSIRLTALDNDFKSTFEDYLAELETSPVRTLQELVVFNEEHASVELPEENPLQNKLTEALSYAMSAEEYSKTLAQVRHLGRTRGIDETLTKYDIDVIIGPADSSVSSLASASGQEPPLNLVSRAPYANFSPGYPIATMPLSYLKLNGRPFGLAALTRAHNEATLVRVLSAWEATFPKRNPPPLIK
ncbi:hypothetical protein GP486_005161 [Trichoglossum hirsutum]|uniref:Amidase domain-containing protein n=1 Tax=Trichoglossum hirsutum TaxID=265104 RepID=A0A9P8RMS6_9PEZI|nr:hypothetical protein GP486_005161 [Trichoglossum hirsutum]